MPRSEPPTTPTEGDEVDRLTIRAAELLDQLRVVLGQMSHIILARNEESEGEW